MAIRMKGLKMTVGNLKKLDKKIRGPIRKQMLTEIGKKTKGYAQRRIQRISVTGNLMKKMHYRVFPDRVSIWNDAGNYAWSWEKGMKPHFIHRNMISEAGYSVGDWMNANGISPKRNYLLVGTGEIGRGIRFMADATIKMQKAMPNILNKYAKMMR